MAGHSKFKNIMHRKGAQDARRSKVFNKIAREITVAAKGGNTDPSANPRLRALISKARVANMTNDRIDRAIKASAGNDAANYEDVRYEGFGPGGVAVIVDALTDNRARTAAEIRMIFSKNGGNLGETGSVAFMFSRIGEIRYPATLAIGKKTVSTDEMFEAALEAGAENVDSDEDAHVITTSVDDLATARDALETRFGSMGETKLAWSPSVMTPPAEFEAAQKLMNLIEALEDNDDVQEVTTNADIPADWMEQLEG